MSTHYSPYLISFERGSRRVRRLHRWQAIQRWGERHPVIVLSVVAVLAFFLGLHTATLGVVVR